MSNSNNTRIFITLAILAVVALSIPVSSAIAQNPFDILRKGLNEAERQFKQVPIPQIPKQQAPVKTYVKKKEKEWVIKEDDKLWEFGVNSNTEADEKEKQAKAKQEAERKKQEALQATPEYMLGRSYRLYQTISLCKKEREGFASVYVNNAQFRSSRGMVKGVENLLARKHNLNTDEIWAKYTTEEQLEKEFMFGIMLSYRNCQSLYMALKYHVADINKRNKVSTVPKKDF